MPFWVGIPNNMIALPDIHIVAILSTFSYLKITFKPSVFSRSNSEMFKVLNFSPFSNSISQVQPSTDAKFISLPEIQFSHFVLVEQEVSNVTNTIIANIFFHNYKYLIFFIKSCLS